MNDDKTKTINSAIKMLPGFISRVRVRCGKKSCRCSDGERHSAYYHVTYRNGRRFRKYVRRADVTEYCDACSSYKALRAQSRTGRAEYKLMLSLARHLGKNLPL